ncbi:hypothetical protein BU26DRAFT_1346 [Trematosphaeria pertusa]|uniref:Uncharacterized protein n=1 Tax=Trematosphaeria pertusa TaxID=390896 RepID=A0A6A6IYF7_9PLEO|nr:uncharacterized protein BU26DRAFT_1346 [Trematosphaeria pertusa]KAF2255519.1 hypothetical protein BU26DRAFT_1346 [Trematosphaeria pertusa]
MPRVRTLTRLPDSDTLTPNGRHNQQTVKATDCVSTSKCTLSPRKPPNFAASLLDGFAGAADASPVVSLRLMALNSHAKRLLHGIEAKRTGKITAQRPRISAADRLSPLSSRSVPPRRSHPDSIRTTAFEIPSSFQGHMTVQALQINPGAFVSHRDLGRSSLAPDEVIFGTSYRLWATFQNATPCSRHLGTTGVPSMSALPLQEGAVCVLGRRYAE